MTRRIEILLEPRGIRAVAELLVREKISFGRRSEGLPGSETQVWLGDSMGEMAAYFTLADVAFIGGSLLPLGGQNLIEAAACGCPSVVGPHTFNFAEVTENLISDGAALRVQNAIELGDTVSRLIGDPASRRRMSDNALAAVERERGAVSRCVDIVAAVMAGQAP